MADSLILWSFATMFCGRTADPSIQLSFPMIFGGGRKGRFLRTAFVSNDFRRRSRRPIPLYLCRFWRFPEVVDGRFFYTVVVSDNILRSNSRFLYIVVVSCFCFRRSRQLIPWYWYCFRRFPERRLLSWVRRVVLAHVIPITFDPLSLKMHWTFCCPWIWTGPH